MTDAKESSQEARKLAEDVAEHQDVDRCVGPCPDLALLLDSALRAERERTLREALIVPRFWSKEEQDGISHAFEAASAKHGHYESLSAVAAFILRHRLLTLSESGAPPEEGR